MFQILKTVFQRHGNTRKRAMRNAAFILAVGFSVPAALWAFCFELRAFGPPPKPYVDVTDAPYNAVPNDGLDDSAAFQSALDDLVSSGGGSLYVPDGGYRFDSRVAVSSGDRGLTIRGASINARLYSNNPDGVFRLSFTGRKEEVTLRDLSVVADYPGAGTAVEVTSPAGGLNDKRVVVVENVHVRFSNPSNYFYKGIVVTGVYRPLISSCSFRGSVDAGDMSDGSPTFRSQTGFDLSNCYAPVVENCLAEGVDTAYCFNSPNAGPEDGAFRFCTADYCKTGIRFDQGTDREPTLWVTECDIRARDHGVTILGRRIFHITGSTFDQLSSAHALQDIDLNHSVLGVVRGNTFNGSLSSGRRNVVIDSDGEAILLAENQYSGSAASAVQVDPGASDVYIY